MVYIGYTDNVVYIGYSLYRTIPCPHTMLIRYGINKIWFIYDMVYTYIFTMVYVRYGTYIYGVYKIWLMYDMVYIRYGIFTIWYRAGPVARSKYELGGSRRQKETERKISKA